MLLATRVPCGYAYDGVAKSSFFIVYPLITVFSQLDRRPVNPIRRISRIKS
jgi:hypothetical protein